MDVTALLASVLASVATVGGTLLAARRFQKIGGGLAQEKLNEILADTAQAAERNMAELRTAFAGCKGRLEDVETELKAVQRTLNRRDQSIDDLRDQVRKLNPDRKGHLDRSDDR